jgi:hypothetical protein
LKRHERAQAPHRGPRSRGPGLRFSFDGVSFGFSPGGGGDYEDEENESDEDYYSDEDPIAFYLCVSFIQLLNRAIMTYVITQLLV